MPCQASSQRVPIFHTRLSPPRSASWIAVICGKADRYLDLAIAAQEIAENFGGNEAQIFVKTYGEMTWDTKKARFFSNLYELF